MKRLKAAMIAALASRRGRIVSFTGALIASGVSAAAARFGLDLSDAGTTAVAAGAAWVVNFALDTVVISINGRGIEAIQAELQAVDPEIKVDRWAGPETTGTVRELVQQMR